MVDVKLCTSDNDISKRWYIEYYVTVPTRKKPVRKRGYGHVNAIKDPVKRLEKLVELRTKVLSELNFQEEKKERLQLDPIEVGNSNSITFFLNLYYNEKSPGRSKSWKKNVGLSLKYFYAYLRKNNLTLLKPREIIKSHIREFASSLSFVVIRTKNNYLKFVETFFNYLINEHDHVLYKSPFRGFQYQKTKSEKNVAYTHQQAEKILKYIKSNDENLFNYITFIALGFLRPKEARNLKVRDIDMENKIIYLPAAEAKTGERQSKPMLGVFYDCLKKMGLEKYPEHYFVFSTGGRPSNLSVYENYFQKRFKKVKDHFLLPKKYTMYGFRHTIIVQLLKSKAPWAEIMKYTGHETLEAFGAYAITLLNEPAIDLSGEIKTSFLTVQKLLLEPGSTPKASQQMANKVQRRQFHQLPVTPLLNSSQTLFLP